MKRWLIAMSDVRAGDRGMHRRRRQQRRAVRDRHRERRLARPGDAADVGRMDRSRAPAVQQDLRRLHGEVPLDHGRTAWVASTTRRSSPPINSGTPPDVVLSFTLDSVGQFCASGAWQDLNPYIEQSGFDVSQFPPSVEVYTSFAGSRCAFPFLTDAYGLYYNTDMFEKAGITDPPKTLTELRARREEAHRLQPRRLDQGGRLRPVARLLRVQRRRTSGTSSARSGTTTTARVGRRDRPAVEGDVPMAARFHRERIRRGDFQTGVDNLAAVRGRRRGRVLRRRRTSRRAVSP